MSSDYDKLLKRGIKQLPEVVEEVSRFEIPKVKGHIQGNKTIISNINEIVEKLRRPSAHIVKFLLKELAAPGEIKGNFFVIGTKIPATRINEKLNEYVEKFVICPVCKKPDTKLKKEGDFIFIICQACGARKSVKG
ncbi:TPA: translation initiation factor IF-2 subunit beta [Candidatus Woesearchaeota archaeon]|nr:translation initiation factor IF-2 subunit beta [Candidatus Woesearchaeota archaeon]HIH39151.1 translation initiation factor IF-2 subunit beta [Candidatus Woesearchaeota archaeon]